MSREVLATETFQWQQQRTLRDASVIHPNADIYIFAATEQDFESNEHEAVVTKARLQQQEMNRHLTTSTQFNVTPISKKVSVNLPILLIIRKISTQLFNTFSHKRADENEEDRSDLADINLSFQTMFIIVALSPKLTYGPTPNDIPVVLPIDKWSQYTLCSIKYYSDGVLEMRVVSTVTITTYIS